MNAVTQASNANVSTVKLLINGEFVESNTREWRDIVNPATQEVLARVPFAPPTRWMRQSAPHTRRLPRGKTRLSAPACASC